ncbi:hypothetical protein TanjilG_21431 [Lupinus angustifolius]|uniref:Uncharacterized protein n=1 Tax=Lupinus angustifolius TaxID=3871 RepID=A0A4P1RN41_LUPAN|nr:hypothetical protein TanjilG_21431 [Lupinus angustifolius]
MEKMNKAFEKVKIMVGMEVEDEEQQVGALDDNNGNFAFMDDFNCNCTKHVLIFLSIFHVDLHINCVIFHILEASRLPNDFEKPEFVIVNIQRDLFYGYDTLMENVSDPSHIDFAHHKVTRRRDRAKPLTFKMGSRGPETLQELMMGIQRSVLNLLHLVIL